MDQDEYNRRRQILEAELEAGIELLRAGFRAQLRSLDMVWMASPENPAPLPVLWEWAQPPRPGGAVWPQAALPEAVPETPALPAPPPKKRWAPGELYNQVVDALERLPAAFDRDDLIPLLSAPPERSSLHRVLEDLRMEGVIERVEAGRQHYPSRYKRKALHLVESAPG